MTVEKIHAPPPVDWSYLHPEGVHPQPVEGRPALTTPQGGKVVLDRPMLKLWQTACGRSYSELHAWSAHTDWQPVELAAALACLAEAGLLQRAQLPAAAKIPPIEDPAFTEDQLVSVVIVSFNSRAWLPGCLDSLHAQTGARLEIIIVDNGSQDGSPDWLAENYPDVVLLRLPQAASLAAAINTGIEASRGDFYLILNPDVVLDPGTVAAMTTVARSSPHCAAVAARLRFLWAPAFLNGLGNFVGAAAYGTDSALGHLDLGQFDHWREIPSACFAAALLPAAAFQSIGRLDDGFPMYYEDSEWCYRARLLGYQILAAPHARVYHAFGGGASAGSPTGLSPIKLRRVTYGRLRFISRLLAPAAMARIRRQYRLEDMIASALAAGAGLRDRRQALRLGWQDYRDHQSEIQTAHAHLQTRRVCSDARLFALQRSIPPPLIWHGLPRLTRDAVRIHYAPWLTGAGRGRFPEMSAVPPGAARLHSLGPLRRALSICRDEGPSALLHRMAKAVQWRLQTHI